MLIDDVTIEVSSGSGGHGRVAFNKTKMNLGPTGGRGGNGGDIYLRGISNIGCLSRFRAQKVFQAEDGKMGGTQNRDGRNGEDLTLNVPVGTVVHFLSSNKKKEITKIGEVLRVAEGGIGGRGNFFFRSPRNTTPKKFEFGKPGKLEKLRLELKLIADIGLIGFPNAGKSSLLNELTNAKVKVANYPFTTLEPNLGVYYDLILADIPGLIEGASFGKGLGIKFLRHIERTGIFFHLVSAQSDDPEKDYLIVRSELEKYNKDLLQKKEYVFLSKCDLLEEKEIKNKIKLLKKNSVNVFPLSLEEESGMDDLKNVLNLVLKDKTVVE